MLNSISNLEGVKTLSKKELSTINGSNAACLTCLHLGINCGGCNPNMD